MGVKKAKTKSKSKSAASKAVSAVKSKLGMGGDGVKHRKKSAAWYAKETLRLKLKKKYEKTKLGMYR